MKSLACVRFAAQSLKRQCIAKNTAHADVQIMLPIEEKESEAKKTVSVQERNAHTTRVWYAQIEIANLVAGILKLPRDGVQAMAQDNKLRINSRIIAPCKECTERSTACSDHCPKDARGEFGYKAWKQAVGNINEKRKTYYDILSTYCKHRRNRNHGKK